MGAIKDTVSKVTGNPVGAIVGGVALFYGAKKFGGVSNTWALVALSVVGVVVGATVQGKIKAASSAPTAATVAAKK